jgi:hypothetical protein
LRWPSSTTRAVPRRPRDAERPCREITHFPNVKAGLGVQIGFGDAAIPKPDGHGGVTVVARITAKEWAAY